MLAEKIPLARVFDERQLELRDARGPRGIDLDRPHLHEQRSIVRNLTLDAPAGDLNLTWVFKILHDDSELTGDYADCRGLAVLILI